MSATDLRNMRISQAEFGRLVGLTRQRVNQLVQCGLLDADDGGVKLLRSLENYWRYTINRRRRLFS